MDISELSIPFISKEPLQHALDLYQSTGGQSHDLVLEFGVYSGRTLRTIASTLSTTTVYGFDGFKGLPETWRPGYEKGEFGEMQGMPPPNVPENASLVIGWFAETLPEFVKAHAGKKVGFLHVDCDIYSSTKTIFDELARGNMFRDGTLITFDEAFNYPGWEEHEMKAFYEFLEAHPEFDVEWLGMQEGEQPVSCRLVQSIKMKK
jgi:hypothetical protein